MHYWLKSCPRCRTGDLHEERDIYGAYIGCVQCGYILSAMQEVALRGWNAAEETGLPAEVEKVAA